MNDEQVHVIVNRKVRLTKVEKLARGRVAGAAPRVDAGADTGAPPQPPVDCYEEDDFR